MYSDSEWQKANENMQSMANAFQNVGQTYANYKLAQETRVREDNATQRRVDDLKKAGLSPTLAAGSPAQASATPSLGGSAIGAWLDAKNGIEAYKQNRIYTEQARLVTEEMRRQNNMSKMAYMYQLGFTPTDYIYDNSGNLDTIMYSPDEEHGHYWRGANFGESPFMTMLRGNMQMYNNEVSASNLGVEMAGKENAWYNFNQGLGAVATGVGLGLNAFNTFGTYGLKKAGQAQQFEMFKQELNRKQNYDNWRTSPHSTHYSNNRGFSSNYTYR